MIKNSLLDDYAMRSLGESLTAALGVTVTFHPAPDSGVRGDALLQRFAGGTTRHSPASTWRGRTDDASERPSPDEVVISQSLSDFRSEVSMRADGKLLGTWYVPEPDSDVRCDAPSEHAAVRSPHDRQTGVRTMSPVSDCPPQTDHESAVALVAQVARLIVDAVSEKERMADAAAYHSELALRKAAALCVLERISDNAPVGLVEIDRDGEISWTNRQARRILGMRDEPSDDYHDRAHVCAVSSIGGSAPCDAYRPIVRQLARGRVVRDVRCVLLRADGTSFALNIDVSADLSENRRIDRAVIALHTPCEGASSSADDRRPSWEEVRALLNVVNTRAASNRAEIAGRIQRGIADSLRYTWLEFDALKQDLEKQGDPFVSGRLETIASLLREATANAVDVGAVCRPQVWDHHGVVSALESRLSDLENTVGIDWSLKDHSNGRDSLDASRCTILFHVGEELIARAADDSHRIEVSLDANEHYWLLSVGSYGEATSEYCCITDGFLDGRIREALRSFDGTIETVRVNDLHVVRYVILPIATHW